MRTAQRRYWAFPRLAAPPVALAGTLLTTAEKSHFNQVQAYEDAIAYRRARLAAPCPNCRARRCDDHAVDLALIATYRRAAAGLHPPPSSR